MISTERPWPEAGRELERIAAHICEILPALHRCVGYCDEGVQLRLFIPQWTTRFCLDFDGPTPRLTLENPDSLARVDISGILDRLPKFLPLVPGYVFDFNPEQRVATVDINLRVPKEMRVTPI